MSVLYGLVTRQAFVLAEYSITDAEHSVTAKKLMQKVEPSTVLKTYVQGNLLFSFYTKKGVSYLCLAPEIVGRELSFRFLEEMERGFQTYQDRAAEFSKAIKALLYPLLREKYSAENLHNLDPLLKVERDLTRVVEVTKGNLGKMIERGTHMDQLKVKTEKLQSYTKRLRATSQDYNYHAWMRKLKLYILVAVLWGLVLYYLYSWVLT